MNLLGPGEYEKLKIVGTRLESSNDPDAPTIVITLAVPGEEEPGDAKLSDFLRTSDKALAFTTKALRAYGWDPEENEWAIGNLASDDNPLIGTEVGPVTIAIEDYTKRDGTPGSATRVKKVGNTVFGFGIGSAEAKTLESKFQKRMRLKQASSFADAMPSYSAPAGAPKQIEETPDF